jgi:hypothetical protein
VDKEWAMITLTPIPGCEAKSMENCINECTKLEICLTSIIVSLIRI